MVGNPFIRLAGLSGAAAVVLGAYGAHCMYLNFKILLNRMYDTINNKTVFTFLALMLKEGLEERKRIYETANRYHFLHTLALFGVPLSRFPRTVSFSIIFD